MKEVDILKELKAEFEKVSGTAWTQDIDIAKYEPKNSAGNQQASASSNSETSASYDVLLKIKAQGDKIRQLKTEKAAKDVIMKEVGILKELKAEFEKVSGTAWTQDIDIAKYEPKNTADNQQASASSNSETSASYDALLKIKTQGDKIRQLKSEKAAKDVIMKEVDILKELKAEFEKVSGTAWTQDIDIAKYEPKNSAGNQQASASSNSESSAGYDVLLKIKAQGDKIRQLKTDKAAKDVIMKEVGILKELKAEFEKVSGTAWTQDIDIAKYEPKNTTVKQQTSQASASSNTDSKQKSQSVGQDSKQKNVKKQPAKETKIDDSKKQSRLGLEVKKSENLADWYSQIITKSEMIEYYNVSGCYILLPWSYGIWEYIKDYIDEFIKSEGVENCYFPIFVSKEVLEKEKDHIADFSPEVAWVTRSGSSELAEPIAIRPTSETVMYPTLAKRIQSHRDLPMKLNQWNNVVRWEFKQPTPFLRTREFLWQEGHSAFQTKAEACEEVYSILDLYARVYEDLLAIPVVKGKKTEKEKFAGGDFTTTTEAFVSANGRAIQGATSHHLGQNFSKMFNIVFEEPTTKAKEFVYQNSWGMTTRTIGVMVMVHGDDKGLVLPPKVAKYQAVVMPVGTTSKLSEENKTALYDQCQKMTAELNANGVRAYADLRDDKTPSWKFNHWELKGVPLRLEIGPRESAAGLVSVVRRDTGSRENVPQQNISPGIKQLLTTVHNDMFSKASHELTTHKKLVSTWDDFCSNLDQGNLLLAPFCGAPACEDRIKADSARDQDTEAGAPSMGAKSLCIPFEQPQALPQGARCIYRCCDEAATYYTMFGRSY